MIAATDSDDIVIDVGATYVEDFIWKDKNGDPIDLTDYVAYMQVRARYSSEDAIFDLSSTGDDPAIQITPSEGKTRVTISSALTGAVVNRKGVYDMLLVSPATRTRLIQGEVRFKKRVTVVADE